MENFASELLWSAHGLNDRDLVGKPPSPTADDKSGSETGLNVAQGTQSGKGEESELKKSFMASPGCCPQVTVGLNVDTILTQKKLGRWSDLRIRTDNIEFTLSQPHSHGGKAEVVKAKLKQPGSTDRQVAVKKIRFADDGNEGKLCNVRMADIDGPVHIY